MRLSKVSRTIIGTVLFSWLSIAIVLHVAKADVNNYNTLDIPTAITAGGSPFAIGTGVYPQNGSVVNPKATGTVAANNLTWTCVSNCNTLYAGGALFGSDNAAHVIWPTYNGGGEIGAVITLLAGTCTASPTSCVVTTNVPVGASVVSGTYTVAVGTNRTDLASAINVNTGQFKNVFTGTAALGNSTWVQAYLTNTCDNPLNQNNCFGFGGAGTAQTMNTMIASRSSDTTSGVVEALVNLCVNDNLVVATQFWCEYDQLEIMPGAGQTSQNFVHEYSLFNFGSVQKTDPFTINKAGGTTVLRLDTGQANQPNTQFSASSALDIAGISGNTFETGINCANGALDTAVLVHPPCLYMPAGVNGQAVAWVRSGQGHDLPAWLEYSTNTSVNGNFLALEDTDIKWGNATGTWLQDTATTLTQFTTSGSASLVLRRGDAVASGALGQVIGQGVNTTPATVPFAQINLNSNSNTAGAEVGSISLQTVSGGSMTTRVNVSNVGLTMLNGGGMISTITVVASLPTCNTAAKGLRDSVTDALTPTFLGVLVGGGAVFTNAVCNGTAWVAG